MQFNLSVYVKIAKMMEELDDDIIQMGLSAQQQSLSLVYQAISATTTHEKDKIIEEMRQTWKLQENCAQQLNNCNASMTKLLANFEEKEKNAKLLYRTLENNTAFLSYYEKHPPTQQNKDQMILSIQEIEDCIKRFGSLSSPNLLSQTQSLKNDIGLLKMRDMTFKRLEELAYTLKKRSFVVDDSEDLSLTVAAEFGDLNGLIQKHEELQKENIQLKTEEISFLNDKIVKRRNLSTLSSSSLSNITIELQNMLNEQERVGNSFPITPEYSDNQVRASFDETCNVTSEIAFTKSEFSTTINPNSITSIVEANSPQDQLDSLIEIVKQQETTIEKLISELNPLRSKVYTEIVTTASQREERMWQLQDKFQNQINEIQDHISETIDTCFNLHNQILMMTNQHGFYGEKYGEWMHLYKALIADHTFLEQIESNNVQICKLLSQSSYSFGLSQMYKEKENSQCFAKYFTDRFNEEKEHERKEMPTTPSHPSEQNGFPVRPPTVTIYENDHASTPINPLMNLHRSGRPRNKSLAPRRKKSGGANNKELLITDSSLEDTKSKAGHNPIEKATREQILNYLALTYDIESKISENPTSYHLDTSGKLHYSLSTLRNHFFEETRYLEAYMRSTLSQLQVAEDLVLRKPKVDAEVMADTEPRTEIEVQTEDESNDKGKKGKGKAPAKGKKK